MTADVVVAGNLSLDDVVTPTGEQPLTAGGDALYAALGVTRWGGKPRLLTLVGDDYPPELLARIERAGIDVRAIRRVPGPTVHYRVTYRADGSRTFEWLGAEERLLLTSPVASDYAALAGAAWLHIAAMPIESQEVAVAAARTAGLPYSLDPHEEYVVGLEDRLAAMVRGAVFLPSELEVRLLFPDLGDLPVLELARRAIERLDAWDPAGVVIKIGELGSFVRVDRRTHHVPALDVAVVDPTGAGDAYCGGFVAGWLEAGDPLIAAGCGTVAAADTIAGFGAFGGPVPPTEATLARLRGLLDVAEPAGLSSATLSGLQRLERSLLAPTEAHG